MSKGGRYGTTEVCRLTGLSYRQLVYWESLNYITPSLVQSEGSGMPHQWSEEDVRKLKLAKRFLDLGFTPKAIFNDGPDALDALLRHAVGSVHA